MALVTQETREWPAQSSVVVGSSLGGFYATWVAQQRGWRGAVINPAVDPARDLAAYIGEQTAFHNPQDRFFFRAEFIDELRALTLKGLPLAAPAETLHRLLAIIATGDEVLSWQEMTARYAGAKMHVVAGSDHALSDFDAHLPSLLQHLKLCD